MLNSDFVEKFGSCLTAIELAKLLKLDRRTVVKYASYWGGVEVTPGTWRFFEKRIKEVLNAQCSNETGKVSLPSQCNSAKGDETKNISGRFAKVKEGSLSLGRGNKEKTGKRTVTDKYGIFESR